MLVEAPLRGRRPLPPDADLDLCVVQAGGGDFRAGASSADVYGALRTYCSERRAEGFRVVVLTVLPASDPVTFEATRLAYDAMLRSSWQGFADGLVDVAADGRIGDAGDNLDRHFYQPDALHLTNAGNEVMASVASRAERPAVAVLPLRAAPARGRGRVGRLAPLRGSQDATLAGGDGLHVVGPSTGWTAAPSLGD